MLTPTTTRQAELLRFIESAGPVSPSYDEMRVALGLASKNAVARLVDGLERKGFIRRIPHLARAIEVIQPAKPTSAPISVFPPPKIVRLPLWGKINLNEHPVRR